MPRANMEEGLYLLQTREFVSLNKEIYKIGRSRNVTNRVNQYPNGTNIMLMIKCKNSNICETNLINLFKDKFIQQRFYGTEYFEGNCYDMIQEICDYVNKNNCKDKIISKKIISDKAVSDKAVSDKAVSDKAVSDKAVSDKAVSNKAVSNKAVNKIVKQKFKVGCKVEKKKQFICPKCNEDFKYTSLLKRHLVLSSRCKKSIEEIAIIINNINSNNDNIINSTISNIICNDCNSIFTKKSSLIYHKLNSKCGKIQIAKSIVNKDGINKLTTEQIKLLYPNKFQIMLSNLQTQISQSINIITNDKIKTKS